MACRAKAPTAPTGHTRGWQVQRGRSAMSKGHIDAYAQEQEHKQKQRAADAKSWEPLTTSDPRQENMNPVGRELVQLPFLVWSSRPASGGFVPSESHGRGLVRSGQSCERGGGFANGRNRHVFRVSRTIPQQRMIAAEAFPERLQRLRASHRMQVESWPPAICPMVLEPLRRASVARSSPTRC